MLRLPLKIAALLLGTRIAKNIPPREGEPALLTALRDYGKKIDAGVEKKEAEWHARRAREKTLES